MTRMFHGIHTALVGANSFARSTRHVRMNSHLHTRQRLYMLFGIAMLLAGCAGDQYGLGGKSADAPKEIVKLGVVESVTPIEMDASSDGSSSVGGIFGQVGGANTGGGRGAVVGTILGGVLG